MSTHSLISQSNLVRQTKSAGSSSPWDILWTSVWEGLIRVVKYEIQKQIHRAVRDHYPVFKESYRANSMRHGLSCS